MVGGMSDQPFSTSVEATRTRRHASWLLSLRLGSDGSAHEMTDDDHNSLGQSVLKVEPTSKCLN